MESLEGKSLFELMTYARDNMDEIDNVRLHFYFTFMTFKLVISSIGISDAIYMSGGIIRIQGICLILDFLKIFGPVIDILEYSVVESEDAGRLAIERAFELYLEDLDELRIFNMPARTRLGFKTLWSVKRVRFQWCEIPQGLCDLDVCFPNVECIDFMGWNNFQPGQTIHYEQAKPYMIQCSFETKLDFESILRKDKHVNILIVE